VLRRAVDDAIASRWLEPTTASGVWPCDVVGAAAVTLRPPVDFKPASVAPKVSEPRAGYTSSAVLDPAALQDLVDGLPDIVKAAASVPLEFRLDVTLGDGAKEVDSDTIESIDKLLRAMSPDLRLRR